MKLLRMHGQLVPDGVVNRMKLCLEKFEQEKLRAAQLSQKAGGPEKVKLCHSYLTSSAGSESR